MSRPLYKTTIVIWSEFDGTQVELSNLAREAEQGEAICTQSESALVAKPEDDPAFGPDASSFFEFLGGVA